MENRPPRMSAAASKLARKELSAKASRTFVLLTLLHVVVEVVHPTLALCWGGGVQRPLSRRGANLKPVLSVCAEGRAFAQAYNATRIEET
jgi:hypothetical protein